MRSDRSTKFSEGGYTADLFLKRAWNGWKIKVRVMRDKSGRIVSLTRDQLPSVLHAFRWANLCIDWGAIALALEDVDGLTFHSNPLLPHKKAIEDALHSYRDLDG